MGTIAADLGILRSLLPTENGLTVFDAKTQETSYGIWLIDRVPYIFDTHSIQNRFVATIELLTEVLAPIRISVDRVPRFCEDVERLGLLPIPYSGCSFKENLHLYAFSGPVRGFDLAATGPSVRTSERVLLQGVEALRPRIPSRIALAQRELLDGRRSVRHPADRDVLIRRGKELGWTSRCDNQLRDSTSLVGTSRL